MDKETKNFFEKLAGVDSREEEFSPEIKKMNEANGEVFEEGEGELAVDVYQTPSAFIIESTIAGINPEDIDISLTPESITIKGSRVKEEKIKSENYICQECFWGRFSRSIILPQEIDPDRVQATIKNGVLKVILPKINKQKTKKIRVKLE